MKKTNETFLNSDALLHQRQSYIRLIRRNYMGWYNTYIMLTHFSPIFDFYSPRNCQKTFFRRIAQFLTSPSGNITYF